MKPWHKNPIVILFRDFFNENEMEILENAYEDKVYTLSDIDLFSQLNSICFIKNSSDVKEQMVKYGFDFKNLVTSCIEMFSDDNSGLEKAQPEIENYELLNDYLNAIVLPKLQILQAKFLENSEYSEQEKQIGLLNDYLLLAYLYSYYNNKLISLGVNPEVLKSYMLMVIDGLETARPGLERMSIMLSPGEIEKLVSVFTSEISNADKLNFIVKDWQSQSLMDYIGSKIPRLEERTKDVSPNQLLKYINDMDLNSYRMLQGSKSSGFFSAGDVTLKNLESFKNRAKIFCEFYTELFNALDSNLFFDEEVILNLVL